MSGDSFNIEETPAHAGVDEAVDQLFSDDVESAVLSVVNPTTGQELLKIAKQHRVAENDPAWLFAHVLVNNKIIADTYENNTKIAANRAQIAVMQRFERDSDKITDLFKKRMSATFDAFENDFEKNKKRIIRDLQYVVDEVETKKMGIKKSTVVCVAVLILAAVMSGWWLGANSIQRLQNDELIRAKKNIDIINKNYAQIKDEKIRNVIKKYLFRIE